MVRVDAYPRPRAQRRHATTTDAEAGVVGAARGHETVNLGSTWQGRDFAWPPVTQLTGGAVLSSDDFESRVERRSSCHPVYGDEVV
jgi:hypothetical protein